MIRPLENITVDPGTRSRHVVRLIDRFVHKRNVFDQSKLGHAHAVRKDLSVSLQNMMIHKYGPQ